MATSFVTLTKQEFEQSLPVGRWEEVQGLAAKEYVYDIDTPNPGVAIRIYSTVDQTSGMTRGYGEDAIRIVYWDKQNNRPLGKGKKVLRVEGGTTIQKRIQVRVDEFLAGAFNQTIVDFKYVEAILLCNQKSGFAQSLLENLHQRGSLSDKQLSYVLGEISPKGYPTLEMSARKNPVVLEEIYTNLLNKLEVENEEEDREPHISETSQDRREPHALRQAANEHNQKSLASPQGDQNLLWSDVEFIQSDDVELVPTSAHKLYQYPFEKFNLAQSMVFPYVDQDKNLVLAFNTSAGKTICAELVMDHVLAAGKKVIYCSPLKVLSQEKYDDWSKNYSDKSLVIMTGDYVLNEAMKKKLATADIITLTSEMLDSRTRRMESEQNYWLNEVGLVIVDESHILTTDRGHAVEVGIMRFTKLNPNAKIIFLSATMPNVREIGDWLTAMNAKKTAVIYSSWRPVQLALHFHEYEVLHRDYWGTQRNKIELALAIAKEKVKAGECTLVFVHDKNTGYRILKELAGMGITAKFHNADLKLEDRLAIETEFRKRKLQVLVSTSTTAWGAVHPNTNITMANGTKKKAKNIRVGDAVLSRNDATGELEHDIVTEKLAYPSTIETHIQTTLRKLVVDENHPVYAGTEVVKASQLSVGTPLVSTIA